MILVATGREISINGKISSAGSEVKGLDRKTLEKLILDGILIEKIEASTDSGEFKRRSVR